MSGCRWNMVSMGFWSPAERDTGEPSGLARPHPAWCLGPSLTKFRLLQEHLRERPANTPDERGTQHQGKALSVELCGLVGEHEEAPGDEKNHQDQRRTLKGWGAVATTVGVSSSHPEFGGQQPPWLPPGRDTLLPAPPWGPGQPLPVGVAGLTSS